MLNLFLAIHVIITLFMIGVILLQRSEGGALGIGGGGGGGGGAAGFMSARGAANILTRATAVLAFLFLANAIVMGILSSRAGRAPTGEDIFENVATQPVAPAEQAPAEPAAPLSDAEEGAPAAGEAEDGPEAPLSD